MLWCWFRQEEREHKAGNGVDGNNRGPHEGDASGVWRSAFGEGNCDEGCRSSDDSATNIRRKTFAGAAKVYREYKRDIVAPEAHLPHNKDTCNEDRVAEEFQRTGIL